HLPALVDGTHIDRDDNCGWGPSSQQVGCRAPVRVPPFFQDGLHHWGTEARTSSRVLRSTTLVRLGRLLVRSAWAFERLEEWVVTQSGKDSKASLEARGISIAEATLRHGVARKAALDNRCRSGVTERWPAVHMELVTHLV